MTKRETGASYASLNWVGETYFNLGSGFDAGDGTLSMKAKTFFDKAAAAYTRMLEIANKDPKYKDQPELIGLRLRLADCYRHAGKFDDVAQDRSRRAAPAPDVDDRGRFKPPKYIRAAARSMRRLTPWPSKGAIRARMART